MIRQKVLFLLWIAGLCGHHTLCAQDTTHSNTYAVVIGITAYQNQDITPLIFADKDATLFAAHLQSKAGGNVPTANIKLLLNEGATIAAIYNALNWLQERCRTKDKAYFYFSGHGDVETAGGSLGYLLAYNSPPNNYRNNAITIEDLNKVANHLATETKATVVLVTDACHSGKLAGDFYKGKQLVASQLRLILNNQVRLAACGVNEEAAEGPYWGGGRGVFSYYLLKGLDGMADLNPNDTIQLQELNRYLDSCFLADKVLIRNSRSQHPVLSGNPYEIMAVVDPSVSRQSVPKTVGSKDRGELKSILNTFKPLGLQFVDYLIGKMKTKIIESKLPFSGYREITKDDLAIRLVDDCIALQKKLNHENDSLGLGSIQPENSFLFADTDTLLILKSQLSASYPLRNSFNEKFIQMVHDKAQDMVNAYLIGDLNELEKREYYYAGDSRYADFLDMLRLVLKIAPQEHFLHPLLAVQEAYLSGLMARMEMATAKNMSAPLSRAFNFQRKALKLESDAAYVYNELGNLYIHSKKFQLADQYFDQAIELAPTWAIPWSNKIRIGLGTGDLKKAVEAVRMADSLQHDLPQTFVNGGLAMAKHGDLLTAESYFKKAIRTDARHFLPYERLGNLYISSGDYEKADWFLSEASKRKEGFTINPEFLAHGPDATKSINAPWKWFECEWFRNVQSSKSKSYARLLDALLLIESNPESALAEMTAVSVELGDAPLLNHAIGKTLFNLKNWKQAEPILLKAIHSYKSDSLLSVFLDQQLEVKTEADSCLLFGLMDQQYKVLEDHYMLASIYEHQNASEKVFKRYAIISTIENRILKDQAGFTGSYVLPDKNPPVLKLIQQETLDEDYMRALYQTPPPMGGYLKMAAVYERSGNYLSAESTYLQQLKINKEAADIRNAQSDPQPFQVSENNNTYYRISVNRPAEAATLDFYRRMLRLFPRDQEWQEKAGMFLYERLSFFFRKVPIEKYALAYKTIKQHAYPFLKVCRFNSEDLAEEQEAQTLSITLPGTGEAMVIPTPKYDPINKSLESLKWAIKLSGDLLPKPLLVRAIAELNSWMDNRREALRQYQELVSLEDPDLELRNQMIDYCSTINESAFAMNQLEMLYRRNQTTRKQNLQLADNYAMSNLPDRALDILKNVKSISGEQQFEFSLLSAKINWLAGRNNEALNDLNSISDSQKSVVSIDSINRSATTINYSIARINALLKKKNEAFEALSTSLKNGLTYNKVLESDPAWDRFRRSKRWKELMKTYSVQLQASVNDSVLTKKEPDIREMMIKD